MPKGQGSQISWTALLVAGHGSLLKIEGLLGGKKMFWAGLLRFFRKERPFGEGIPVVSKQTVEEGKGIHNSDFLVIIYLCLKSSSLSENRHSRKNS